MAVRNETNVSVKGFRVVSDGRPVNRVMMRVITMVAVVMAAAVVINRPDPSRHQRLLLWCVDVHRRAPGRGSAGVLRVPVLGSEEGLTVSVHETTGLLTAR